MTDSAVGLSRKERRRLSTVDEPSEQPALEELLALYTRSSLREAATSLRRVYSRPNAEMHSSSDYNLFEIMHLLADRIDGIAREK